LKTLLVGQRSTEKVMATDQEKVEQFSCIGHSVPRIDALDKVLGRAVYSEDLSFPGMLYGRVLRAGVPHAVIEEIDASQARAMKGVVYILCKDPGLTVTALPFGSIRSGRGSPIHRRRPWPWRPKRSQGRVRAIGWYRELPVITIPQASGKAPRSMRRQPFASFKIERKC
jgi:hypothetical protein